jgi:hypothetical protein
VTRKAGTARQGTLLLLTLELDRKVHNVRIGHQSISFDADTSGFVSNIYIVSNQQSRSREWLLFDQPNG